MRGRPVLLSIALALFAAYPLWAEQSSGGAPYRVLRRANVGGEGRWDYIYADSAGRRLYIIRQAGEPPGQGPSNAAAGSAAAPAPASASATGPAAATRLSIYDLATLRLVGEIAGVGGQGTAVDPWSGHGFTSSKPVTMFDTKTMKVLKTIEVAANSRPDGIYFDGHDRRVYVFSHPTQDATVIDAANGTVLGTIKLGGEPEQAVGDGKGTLYAVLEEDMGSVAVIDEATMKVVRHFPLGDAGRCSGLAIDAQHGILFAACGRSGAQQPSANANPFLGINPVVVVLSAKDGKILAREPLTAGSDGATFNPKTLEAFVTTGNGGMTIIKENGAESFAVEQNLDTMNGARTITFDAKTQHLFTMADKRGPFQPPAPGGRMVFPRAEPGTFTILEVGR